MKKIVPIFCIVMLISSMVCSFKITGGKYIGEVIATNLGLEFSKIVVVIFVFLFLYLSNKTTKGKFPELEKLYRGVFTIMLLITIATSIIFR